MTIGDDRLLISPFFPQLQYVWVANDIELGDSFIVRTNSSDTKVVETSPQPVNNRVWSLRHCSNQYTANCVCWAGSYQT